MALSPPNLQELQAKRTQLAQQQEDLKQRIRALAAENRTLTRQIKQVDVELRGMTSPQCDTQEFFAPYFPLPVFD